jgi:hypothetical protein
MITIVRGLAPRELTWGRSFFFHYSDAAQMAPAVRAAVVDIVAEKLADNDRDQAEAYVARLHEQGRWATDVWF